MSGKRTQLKAVKDEKARQKRRSRKKKRIAVLVIECVLLALLSAILYVVFNYHKIQRVDINTGEIGVNEGIRLEGYTTIALFGGDSREGVLDEGTHADTIIVASLDNQSGEIRMISLYRDTLVQQEDGSYNKANYAYFEGGPQESLSMLNRNLDLDIKDYVTVDFKALVHTIDLVGGLDLELSEEEVACVNEYIQETAYVSGIRARFLSEGGEQHLDGTQAVTYARIRSTEGGDLTRTHRQRVIIEKLFERIKTANLKTVNEIITTVFPQVSTSFSLGDIAGLAKKIKEYKLGERAGFPFECDTSYNYGDVGSVVVPEDLTDNVVKLHEFLFPEEEGYMPTQVVTQISADIAYIIGMNTEGEQSSGDDSQF